MNNFTKQYRKNIADIFLKSLTENSLEWKKNWSGLSTRPVNAVTGKKYKGINTFYLSFIATARAIDGKIDPRWATFNQAKSKGWKIKKGAKGYKVEYWQPYNFLAKKQITWDEYHAAAAEDKVGVISKYYTVFNGNDIEGIPPLQETKVKGIVEDALIEKIRKGMDIQIINDGGDRAYYSPSRDEIHLPARDNFFSSYDYACTALHELSHATGAKTRLNREQGGGFGSEKYAYEELVAEISSCFMGADLQIEQTQEHIDNHKAYVQSWIKAIQEKPDSLVKAIKDAEKAANLLEYHAGILTRQEYNNTLQESEEVPEHKVFSEEQVRTMEARADMQHDLRKHGFKATKKLIQKIETLDQVTGKRNSISDIHKYYKENTFQKDPETNSIIKSIGKILEHQEMGKLQNAAPIR